MSAVQTKSPAEELADFLLSMPSLEQIVSYKVPDMLDQRLHDLLDRNTESKLTRDEQEELAEFLQMDQFLALLKLKAQIKLKETK